MESGAINYTLRQPLGVVGCISPWNLPLYLLTWKIAPALAAGNCVVAKPSEVTPMTAFLLAQRLHRGGAAAGRAEHRARPAAPRSALRCVTHPDVRAISFTGSTRDRARRSPPPRRRSSRSSRSSWAARTRTSSSPTATSTTRGRRHGARRLLEPGRDLPVRLARPGRAQLVYERFRDAFVARVKRSARRRSRWIRAPIRVRWSRRQHFDKVMGCDRAGAAARAGASCAGGAACERCQCRCREGWFVQPTVIEGLGRRVPHQPGRDLRAGGHAHALRRRGRGARDRQRHLATGWPPQRVDVAT